MSLSLRTHLNPSFFIHVLLPLILASVVIDENLTFVLLVLSFFCNPAYYKMLADDRVRVFHKRVFLLFCAVIVLVVANGSLLAGTNLTLIFEQHHRLFIFLLLGPVIADLTYVSLRQVRIDTFRIYSIFHLGLLAFVLIKLVYVLVSGGVPSNINLEALTGRGSGFFSRNPNFFDDYAVILICASIWTTFPAVRQRRTPHNTLLWLAPLITAAFFWNIIIFGESRGGWLGVIAMSLFALVVLTCLRRFKAALVSLVLLALLSTMHWDRIVPETTKSWPSIERIITRTAGDSPNTTESQVVEQAGEKDCADGEVRPEDVATEGRDLGVSLRLVIYKFAFDAWLERPLLGYGAYDKYRLAKEIPTTDRCAVLYLDHTHNLYLELAIGGGLVLLFAVLPLVCAPLLFFGIAAWQRRPGALLYLPIASFSIFFLVENLFGLNFTNLHLGVAISWLLMTVVSFVAVYGLQRNGQPDR